MSERYERQVRKTLNKMYEECYEHVCFAIDRKIKCCNFRTRIKMAWKVLTKKSITKYF